MMYSRSIARHGPLGLELAQDRVHTPDDTVEDHEARRHVELLDDAGVWTLDVEDHAERVAHPLPAVRELVGEVRHVRAADVLEHLFRVEPVAGPEEARRLHRHDQLLGIAVHDDRVERRAERVPLARRPALHEAVVEERDAAVVVELVVARVRVAVEHPAPQDGVLGEPPQDLRRRAAWWHTTPWRGTARTTCRRPIRW